MKSDYLQAAGKSELSIPRDVKDRFRAGLKLLDVAAANVSEAGTLFAGIPEDTWRELIAEAPAPMRRTLGYVREVGEGKMIPQLATAVGEAAQRLRGLPLEDQTKLWADPLEMYAPGRIGRHAKYMRYVTEMGSDEVKRAFERDGRGWRLRSFEEQRLFNAEQEAAEREAKIPHGVDRPGRWAVRNGKVYLAPAKANSGLSKRDIETILKDLEDEA